MLQNFVTTHRALIISRAQARVELRSSPSVTSNELLNGVPLFLDQLVEVLSIPTQTREAIGPTAARHGANLLRMGFSISQVVHDYGDICQVITALAEEENAEITIEEFHTLNRCLDDAIAEAVSEYSRLRQRNQHNDETDRIGAFAHEMRNKLSSAMLAYEALKLGRVGIGGSTSAVIDRNLRGLRDLIDGALIDVRIDSGSRQWERVMVADLLAEIEIDASFSANDYAIVFNVRPCARGLEIRADHAILSAALHNLLQNAFKFSRLHGRVSLTTTFTPQRVMFAVEDECGGLPRGDVEELFAPYTQKSDNKRGLGLGLAISRKAVAVHGGEIHAVDIPGKGCIFTIDVPRYASNVSQADTRGALRLDV